MGYKHNSRLKYMNLIQNTMENRLRHAIGLFIQPFRYKNGLCFFDNRPCLIPNSGSIYYEPFFSLLCSGILFPNPCCFRPQGSWVPSRFSICLTSLNGYLSSFIDFHVSTSLICVAVEFTEMIFCLSSISFILTLYTLIQWGFHYPTCPVFK